MLLCPCPIALLVLLVNSAYLNYVAQYRRLAMIAIAGFVAQELVEKKEIVYQIGLREAADSVPPT